MCSIPTTSPCFIASTAACGGAFSAGTIRSPGGILSIARRDCRSWVSPFDPEVAEKVKSLGHAVEWLVPKDAFDFLVEESRRHILER